MMIVEMLKIITFLNVILVFTDGSYNIYGFENIFTDERTITVVDTNYGDCNQEKVFRIIIIKIIAIKLITMIVTLNKFLKS